MWPLHPLTNQVIGITITQNYLVCSWVEEISSVLHLKGYTKQPFLKHEVIDGVLYNFAAVTAHIQKFINRYSLNHAHAIIDVEKSTNLLTKELIMQYQLLALRIPVHCIMITSYINKDRKPSGNALCHEPTFHILEPNEADYIIDLYTIGKKLL